MKTKASDLRKEFSDLPLGCHASVESAIAHVFDHEAYIVSLRERSCIGAKQNIDTFAVNAPSNEKKSEILARAELQRPVDRLKRRRVDA